MCLDGLDFSAVRLMVKLVDDADVPPVLLVHDAFAENSTEVCVRLVWSWNSEEDGRLHGHYDVAGGSGGARRPHLSDIDEESIVGAAPSPPRAAPPPPSSVISLWGRIVARRQVNLERASALASVDGLPADCCFPLPAPPASPPTVLWDQILARRLTTQFPEPGMDADQVHPSSPSHFRFFLWHLSNQISHMMQWYVTLRVPATPLVTSNEADEVHAEAVLPPVPLAIPVLEATQVVELHSGTSEFEHEDAARKQRVRRKRAVDSAFKARRSSHLAAKEDPKYLTMLSKAKAAKASRFNLEGGSPRFQDVVAAAGFDGTSDPGPIPLPRLKALAASCGVDPDAIVDVASVSSSST
jgi:hypothetical protein